MSSAPIAAPLTQDLPCMNCRYNLRTLSPAQLCPECATPVSQSIARYRDNLSIRPLQLMSRAATLLAALFLIETARELAAILNFYPSDALAALCGAFELLLFLPALIHLLLAHRNALGPPRLWKTILFTALAITNFAGHLAPDLLLELYRRTFFIRRTHLFMAISSIDLATSLSDLALVLAGWLIMHRLARRDPTLRLALPTRLAFALSAFLSLAPLAYSICDFYSEWSDNDDFIESPPTWVGPLMGAIFLAFSLTQLTYWSLVAVRTRQSLTAHKLTRPKPTEHAA